MGKIEGEASINHFSHPHPLNLVTIQSWVPNEIACSACKKDASGLTYICGSCNYCLHKTCSNMPQSLNHMADQGHALALLPSPAYSDGAFKCNACGVTGTGFCYHCEECQLDLHPVCAFMRSIVEGGAHDHPLKICFEPPYENKAFICDVCGGSGSNHWLYRCNSCGFDAHLKCARANKRQPRMDQSDSTTAKSPRPPIYKSRSVLFPPSGWGRQQGPQIGTPISSEGYASGYRSLHQLHGYETAPVYVTPSFVQQPTRNDTVQNVVSSLIEGIIEGAENQIGQALMQGAFGN